MLRRTIAPPSARSQATEVTLNQPVPRVEKLRRIASAPWRKLPDFLIIGAQKGGTSSLFYYLSQHPQVLPAAQKEVHYFDMHYRKGPWWYRSFFPYKDTGKMTGEASPCYLFHPTTPERVRRLLPGVRLIVLLRDPVRRAYSQYQMMRLWGFESLPTFAEAIRAEERRLHGEFEKMRTRKYYRSFAYENFGYLARSRYSQQLDRWLQYFPREQFLVLRSEAFFEAPATTLARVYDFLGLQHYRPKDLCAQHVGDYPPLGDEEQSFLHGFFDAERDQLQRWLGEEQNW